MSQITCCPSCHTRFKVVPDQLRISDGWVRCGHCKEIFDASASLQDDEPLSLLPAWAAQEPEPEPAPAPAPEPPPAPQAEPELKPAPEPAPAPAPPPALALEPAPIATAAAAATAGLASAALQQVLAHDDGLSLALELPARRSAAPEAEYPAAKPAPVPEEPELAFPEIDPALEAELRELLPSRPPASRRKAAPAPNAAQSDAAQGAPSQREGDAEDDDDDEAPQASPEPGFVRAARRQAFWRRPLVRALLLLLWLLAAAGLAAQWAWHERNALAAAQPQLRPWLERACAHWQCQLAPPQNIAAVAIDSAGLTKIDARSDMYQLQVALKNHAPTAVAMPALELTLTDAHNQVLLRRVLLPAELGAPAQLAAQGEWAARLPVQLSGPALGLAGYSVLAFYP